MPETITSAINLETVDCCKCGGVFAVNKNWNDSRRVDGVGFHCPYCDSPLSYGTSYVEGLKRQIGDKDFEIQRERQRHDQTKAELRETESRRRAEKGAKMRIKNRVANGVCPCCKRTFQNLAQHMHQQHPKFVETD